MYRLTLLFFLALIISIHSICTIPVLRIICKFNNTFYDDANAANMIGQKTKGMSRTFGFFSEIDDEIGFVFYTMGRNSYLDLGVFVLPNSFTMNVWMKPVKQCLGEGYCVIFFAESGETFYDTTLALNKNGQLMLLRDFTTRSISKQSMDYGVWSFLVYTFCEHSNQNLIYINNSVWMNTTAIIQTGKQGGVVGFGGGQNMQAQKSSYYQAMFFNTVLNNKQIQYVKNKE